MMLKFKVVSLACLLALGLSSVAYASGDDDDDDDRLALDDDLCNS